MILEDILILLALVGALTLFIVGRMAWEDSERWYHWPRAVVVHLGGLLLGLLKLLAYVAVLAGLFSLLTMPVASVPLWLLAVLFMSLAGR